MINKVKVRLGIVVALLLLMGFGVLQIAGNQRLRLVSSTPALKSELATSTSTIRLVFNKELDTSIEYTDYLEGNIRIINGFEVDGKTILIKLGGLDEGSRYSFTLRNLRAKSGQTLDKLPISFEAVYIPYNKLPREQQDLEIEQTDKDNQEDPIQKFLPHQGDRFYLESEFTTSENGEAIFVLNAQLFLTRADLGSGREAAITRYKNDVAQFITSRGLDPSKYLIRYIYNEPPSIPN